MPVHLLLGVAGLLFLTGGVAGLIGAIVRWRREKRAATGHLTATGRIAARYLPKGGEPHPTPPCYTIDFTTADGRAVRLETDSVGWTPRDVGDEVDVAYDPAAPDQSVVRGGERVAAALFALGGMVLTLVGLLMALGALDAAMHRSSG